MAARREQDPRTVEEIGAALIALVDAEQKGETSLPPDLTLEQLLTDPRLAAFQPSAVQRALVRAVDGEPIGDLLTPEQRMFHFGTLDDVTCRARAVILRTGVRAGKSLIAAMALLLSILTCQFRRAPEPHETPDADGLIGVRPGERVRAIITAPRADLAKTVYAHVVGTMMASAILRPLIVDKDGQRGEAGAESMRIRRPSDGAIVEVALVAASGGGTNLRSTWLAGIVFDEADFFDAEDAAVNLADQIRAARPRLLARAQAWIVSSPWSDSGPYNDMFVEAFGKPGRVLALHSDSRSMNPTLDREEEAAERARDPVNAAREWDAIPLSANSSQFFPADAIIKATSGAMATAGLTELPPLPDTPHYAGTDLGFRKNSSALAIARREAGKVRLAYREELQPTKGSSLKPSEVCKGFADKCVVYGAKSMRGDLHYVETAREELGKRTRADGIVTYDEWAVTADTKTEAFTEFRRRAQEGQLDLPNDQRLIQQMKGVTSRPMPGGKIQVQLPKQGASHADLLTAIVIACIQVPTTDRPPMRGTVSTQNPDSAGVGW